MLTATSASNGAYILVPTGWAGAGDYDGIRSYLSSELSANAS